MMQRGGTVEFDFRGLEVVAEIEDYDCGVYMYADGSGEPPYGGCCDALSWEVGDINELLLELDFNRVYSFMLWVNYKVCRDLPKTVIQHINDEWERDICEAAEERHWG